MSADVARTHRGRSLLGRVGLALLGLVLACFGAEFVVRLVRPAGPLLGPVVRPDDARRSLFERDPSLMMRLVPGSSVTLYEWESQTEIRVNALGLRGAEVSAVAAAPRVLALGDSFTLGLQVAEDQAWPGVLQRRLTERMGEAVEVLNGGCEDYGTKQEVMLLERVLEDVELDAVVVAFFLGNDLRDNLRRLRRLPRDAMIVPAEDHPDNQRAFAPPLGPAGWSHLLHWVRHFSRVRALAAGPATNIRVGEDLQFYVEPAALEQLGSGTRDAFDQLAAICASRSLPCLLALIPPDFVAEPARAEERFAAAGLDPETAELDAIARAVEAWAPSSLPVVDLTPSLRAAEGPDRYLRHDGHWTPEGHVVAAEALVEPVARMLRGER